jgi:hypothetical protein
MEEEQLLQIHQFIDFINTRCIQRGDVEESAKNLDGAFKIYYQDANNQKSKDFTEYLDGRFISKRIDVPNSFRYIDMYVGIKLRDVQYNKQHLIFNDEEICIFGHCVFSPSKTVLFSSILEEYKDWKRTMKKPFDEENDTIKLKLYLKQCPYILSEIVWTQKGNGPGFYGLGLKSERTHRKSSTGCQVEKRDLQENVLTTYETIKSAASIEKISDAKMSHSIKDRTVINGEYGDYYFCKAPKNVIKLN